MNVDDTHIARALDVTPLRIVPARGPRGSHANYVRRCRGLLIRWYPTLGARGKAICLANRGMVFLDTGHVDADATIVHREHLKRMLTGDEDFPPA